MLCPTKYPFAIFGLFGSMSISFRAANIVVANRMANFLSSVTLELLDFERVRKQEKLERQFTFSGSTNP